MQTTTPETDAFTTSFISIDDPEGNKRWVPSEFARVLERDRDEAREELNNIRLNLGEDAEGYTLLHAVAALQNERDELHYKLQDAKQSLEVALQELSSTNK